MKISTKTSLVSLLGYPLAQTFAPQLFNATFRELDMDYLYFPIEVENENLETIVKAIRCMNYAGFNVTKPNKIQIIDYLDELDELAAMIGSVNVVTVRDGVLKGYNTDGIGFLMAFKEETAIDIETSTFLFFGAGGASRAVASTLAYHGARRLIILDTFDDMAKRLAGDINNRIRSCAEYYPFDKAPIEGLIQGSDVLINGSGVGMYPHTDRTPVDPALLRPEILVADFTYNPAETRLLKDAMRVGCKVMNGIGMVINQGIKGFALITGKPEPTAIMHRVMSEITESSVDT